MARLNAQTKTDPVVTHEGGKADRINAEQSLRRAVMACLLWEDQFYESGVSIANRLKALVPKVNPEKVAEIALYARGPGNLRHAPLLLTRELLRHPERHNIDVALVVEMVVQRADELGELVAMYWADDAEAPLSAPLKRGLARAFRKFDEYQLAKYNRKDNVRLVDVMRLVHPTPEDQEQAELWRRLRDEELKTPDTWETNLSGGADKRETFTRLLMEDKLGYMALLRNLRNMEQADVDRDLIKRAILARKGARRVLPFRYVTAARAAPSFEPQLQTAMLAAIADSPRLPGTTVVVVDTSGSMQSPVSLKSEVSRVHAAAALASMVNGDEVRLFSFGDTCGEKPHRPGLAGVSSLKVGEFGHYTRLGDAIRTAQRKVKKYDRIIAVTDEQTADRVGEPGGRGYIINVASYENGVGYHNGWTHISGFSDATLKYMAEMEMANL